MSKIVRRAWSSLLKNFLRRDEVLQHRRQGQMKYLTDREIIAQCSYPASFPTTHVPVPKAKISSTRARRAFGHLYKQFKEPCM